MAVNKKGFVEYKDIDQIYFDLLSGPLLEDDDKDFLDTGPADLSSDFSFSLFDSLDVGDLTKDDDLHQILKSDDLVETVVECVNPVNSDEEEEIDVVSVDDAAAKEFLSSIYTASTPKKTSSDMEEGVISSTSGRQNDDNVPDKVLEAPSAESLLNQFEETLGTTCGQLFTDGPEQLNSTSEIKQTNSVLGQNNAGNKNTVSSSLIERLQAAAMKKRSSILIQAPDMSKTKAKSAVSTEKKAVSSSSSLTGSSSKEAKEDKFSSQFQDHDYCTFYNKIPDYLTPFPLPPRTEVSTSNTVTVISTSSSSTTTSTSSVTTTVLSEVTTDKLFSKVPDYVANGELLGILPVHYESSNMEPEKTESDLCHNEMEVVGSVSVKSETDCSVTESIEPPSRPRSRSPSIPKSYRSRSHSRSRSRSRRSRSRKSNRYHRKRSSRSPTSSRSSRSRGSRSRSSSVCSSSSCSSVGSRKYSRRRRCSRSWSRSRSRSREYKSYRRENYRYTRSKSPKRTYRTMPPNKYRNRNISQMEERRVVYVGNIPEGTTRADLRTRFCEFGPIEEVSVHFRDHGDNYGFVTFTFKNDAYDAIEHGNDNPHCPKYDLCFGGRRQFCKTNYADLDSQVSYDKYYYSQGKSCMETDDYDALLQAAMSKPRGRRH